MRTKAWKMMLAVGVLTMGGCASITKDDNTLVQVNAEGCPVDTECTLSNKKGPGQSL